MIIAVFKIGRKIMGYIRREEHYKFYTGKPSDRTSTSSSYSLPVNAFLAAHEYMRGFGKPYTMICENEKYKY